MLLFVLMYLIQLFYTIFVLSKNELHQILSVIRPALCSGMNSTEHQALLPLDESWRCDRGMELYEVPCAKRCGNVFGNDKDKNHYSIKTKKNDIFVCSNVATGTCSFAICKKCYSIAFDDRTTRGKRSRTRSSRLVG